MRTRSGCECGGRASEEFDALKAYERLSAKYNQLAEAVAHVLSRPAAGLRAAASLGTEAAEAMKAGMVELLDTEELFRIVGGKPIGPAENPECCLIGRQNTNGTMNWFCTGVLVHPRVVLTAAHCYNPDRPANVVALRASNAAQLSEAEVLHAKRMVAHPGYLKTQRLDDIAVMILREEARTAPVVMATVEDLSQAEKTRLVGFGNDDIYSTRGFGIKRAVEVPITHVRRNVSDRLDDYEVRLGFESDTEFVAGGQGYDSCNGDSGGPAYINVNGSLRVAGLTSRATSAATTPCGEGGIYTRVDTYREFIRSVAGDFGIQL
jgi:endonuclease G